MHYQLIVLLTDVLFLVDSLIKYLHNKGDYDFEDYISGLPDEVLVDIVSRLTLKDAAVTSALSKRWKFLWTSSTSLRFDATKKLDKIAVKPELCETERPRYVNWVNSVLRQYRGPAIEEFRVCFHLDRSSSCTIDRWIMFAMEKQVKRLELDLLERGDQKSYSLPCELLLGHSKSSSLKQSCSYGPSIQPCVGFKYLKDLSLKSINVTDKVLEYFLSNCSFLERLSVHGSGSLVNLRISGSSLLLKHLEIVECMNIKSIDIFDTNLVSFKYLGGKIRLLLENVPLLVEVSIGRGTCGLVYLLLRKLSCCLSQLEILTLDVTSRLAWKIKPNFFPEFTNLKRLVLQVKTCDDVSLLGFTSLLKACPYLQIFVLKLVWSSPSRTRIAVRKAVNHPHQHLKVVELAGYYGRTSDVELAMYFIENAVALEKMVINPRNQYVGRCPLWSDENMHEFEQSARICAKEQLVGKVPKTVKLVIL